MGGSKKQTIAYRYYLGIHKALCHGPIDRVLGIRVDEKEAWTGDTSMDGNRIYINKPGLFGGDPPEGEGGIQGYVDIEMGEPAQGVNSYLANVIPNMGTAFRGVCCAVLNQVFIGTSPYLKTWGWLVQRIHQTGSQGETQWYPAYAAINDYDMNPMHIIRECVTNRDWGMGTDPSFINNANFEAAARTLHSEGFGLSVLWDAQKPLNEFLTDILEHIDGALYVNRRTGLFEINLIRDDYDADDLPLLDEDHIIEITDYTKPLIGDLTSQVTVQYWDRDSLANSSVTVQDIALSRQQGTAIATTKQYPAICNGDLANRVAMRDLRTVSTPLIGCTVKASRSIAQDLVIGDVFKMSWLRLGIQEITMRVIDADYGTETNPEITMTVVQDIFAFGDSVYAPPPPTDWEPPVSTPQVPPVRAFSSAPYRELVQILGQAEAESLPVTSEFLLAAGVRPTSDALAMVWINDSGAGGDMAEKGEVDFAPMAVTTVALGRMDTSVNVSQLVDIDLVETGTLAAIGTELIRINGIAGNVLTISRGLCDTVPVEHPAQSTILMYDDVTIIDDLEYVAGETIRSQLLTKTVTGTLDPESAPIDTETLDARQGSPYPAGNVRLNTSYFPETFEGDIELTWAHRDRIQQADRLYDFTTGSIGPESGTTYAVNIYGDGTLRKSFSGLTGTSVTYTTTEEIEDHGGYALAYTFEILTSREGIEAFQSTEFTVERTDQPPVTTSGVMINFGDQTDLPENHNQFTPSDFSGDTSVAVIDDDGASAGTLRMISQLQPDLTLGATTIGGGKYGDTAYCDGYSEDAMATTTANGHMNYGLTNLPLGMSGDLTIVASRDGGTVRSARIDIGGLVETVIDQGANPPVEVTHNIAVNPWGQIPVTARFSGEGTANYVYLNGLSYTSRGLNPDRDFNQKIVITQLNHGGTSNHFDINAMTDLSDLQDTSGSVTPLSINCPSPTFGSAAEGMRFDWAPQAYNDSIYCNVVSASSASGQNGNTPLNFTLSGFEPNEQIVLAYSGWRSAGGRQYTIDMNGQIFENQFWHGVAAYWADSVPHWVFTTADASGVVTIDVTPTNGQYAYYSGIEVHRKV